MFWNKKEDFELVDLKKRVESLEAFRNATENQPRLKEYKKMIGKTVDIFRGFGFNSSGKVVDAYISRHDGEIYLYMEGGQTIDACRVPITHNI